MTNIDHKDVCHICSREIVRGQFHKEYSFDPEKTGYADDSYQAFMNDIRQDID